MKDLSGFPTGEIEFDTQGAVVNAGAVQDVLNFLKGNGRPVSDLFIMSHGWNNDMNEARALYAKFFAILREVLDSAAPASIHQRQFGVIGVLWPSKKFADSDLIPGGAAAFDPSAALQIALDNLKTFFDTPEALRKIDDAKALADRLDEGSPIQDAWTAKIRELLPPQSQDSEDGSDRFFATPGGELLRQLQAPLSPPFATPSGEGGAAGFGRFFGGIERAALEALNYTTYYLMKDRAGVVGRTGVHALVRAIQSQATGVKIHLIGHSLGARLVTAAIDGPPGQPIMTVSTLTLLQAAFSHYGFARNYEADQDGLFRKVVTGHKVLGPILISRSRRDTVVSKAYAIASAVAGQVAQALGDRNDRYGGLGRNGAQATPEAVEGVLGPVGADYRFAGGSLYNLTADNVILDHSDICKPQVAYALLASVGSA